MSEKNKTSNIILEIFTTVVVIVIPIIAYKWGVFSNKDGSLNSDTVLFLILPIAVVIRTLFNFYRNYKYRKK